MSWRIIPCPVFRLSEFFRPAALAICILGGLCLTQSTAQSQELSQKRDATAGELQQLQAAISLSEEKRREMMDQIKNLDKDRETINRTLIETTKKSRGIEKRITKAGTRLSQLRDEEGEVRASLRNKSSLLAEVLGALQRIGHKPPPALLVTPDDALSSVRSAILLGSVVPEMRFETEVLITQLQDLARISTDIDKQRQTLSEDLASLAQEEERLNLLLEEKQRIAGQVADNLARESARAAELAAKSTSLQDLIASLEAEIESVRKANEAAKLADAERKRREAERIAAAKKFQEEEVFSDPARIAPAIAFEKAKGLLPLPVEAELASAFGADDGSGEPVSGINLRTRENARVISPTDGWIVYAGPFRSYGQLLILNAGQGYHVVLAGMEDINVKPGQFVIVGEPLGRMGAKRLASVGQIDVSTTKPILYVEFRKGDTPVDPTPWWADKQLERDSNGS